jgi:hypothetical protein
LTSEAPAARSERERNSAKEVTQMARSKSKHIRVKNIRAKQHKAKMKRKAAAKKKAAAK